MQSPSVVRPRWWSPALWVLVLATGAALRFANIETQVLGGDELHAVRAAINLSLDQILTSFAVSDHCLPLAAYGRLLVLAGLDLSEMRLRLPSLLAGLAALIVLPLLVRRRLGPAGARLFALLLAVSPLLVIYSRIARPYMYCAAAPLAVWFTPVAAPLVAAPPYLVVHRNLPGDDERLSGGATSPPAQRRTAELARAGREMADTLNELWGPPPFDNGERAVWDLAAVRPMMPGAR